MGSCYRNWRSIYYSYEWQTYNLDGLTTSEAQREAMIAASIALYKGEESPVSQEQPSTIKQVKRTSLTKQGRIN